MAEKDQLAETQKTDREPWSPRIDRMPLFINSADYERSLGEDSSPPDIEISGGEPKDIGKQVAPPVPNPILKPE
jgi:hypothetical protein